MRSHQESSEVRLAHVHIPIIQIRLTGSEHSYTSSFVNCHAHTHTHTLKPVLLENDTDYQLPHDALHFQQNSTQIKPPTTRPPSLWNTVIHIGFNGFELWRAHSLTPPSLRLLKIFNSLTMDYICVYPSRDNARSSRWRLVSRHDRKHFSQENNEQMSPSASNMISIWWPEIIYERCSLCRQFSMMTIVLSK